MLPLALDVTGLDVLVIGAGKVGASKARQLVEAGARVRVVSREVLAELPSGLASLEVRDALPDDLDGARFVVVATGEPQSSSVLAAAARERGVWINVVDVPSLSDVYFMALHRTGPVTISVSTNGASPALAQWIRDYVVEYLPLGLGDLALELADQRRAHHERGESTEGLNWRRKIEEWSEAQSRSRRGR